MVGTTILPRDYVKFLCTDGLSCNAGKVKLQRYLSLAKGNSEIDTLFKSLNNTGIADTDTLKTALDTVTSPEWWIMWKGQGYHPFFIRFWNWLWDNQEQLRDKGDKYLKGVYAKYFAPDAPRRSPNPIQCMVEDHYFGMECIGFVSNYLRHVGEWNSYKGVNNHSWKLRFPDPVNKLSDVRPLDLLEWTKVGHIALVDKVWGMEDGKLQIDISQCSGFPKEAGGFNGPMSNYGVELTPDGALAGQACFQISGTVPVSGQLQIRRMPTLVYQAPEARYHGGNAGPDL